MTSSRSTHQRSNVTASPHSAVTLPIAIPATQNWSCHNCGGCCREHQIEITGAEHARIVAQGWTAADGVPPGVPLFRWHAGPVWNKQYRLNHRADGGCVFLNEQGLCRIHAKFGEPAKPLACQLYPYVFHPSSRGASVSVRFSCPSVVGNRGRAVSQQRPELLQLAQQVIPPGQTAFVPPALNSRGAVSWPIYDALSAGLQQALVDEPFPVVIRVLRVLSWLPSLDACDFSKVSPAEVRTFFDVAGKAAKIEVPSRPPRTAVSRSGGLDFRLLCAIYARKDTAATQSEGWWGRWKLLRAILKYAAGRGPIPVFQPGLLPVPFEELEASWPAWPPEVEELWTRYFRVKIEGHHFCGRAFYNRNFVEGAAHLLLMVPVVSWLARWHARSQSRTHLITEDFAQALAMADHHQGYSPLLNGWGTPARVRRLWRSGDLSKLVGWYAS